MKPAILRTVEGRKRSRSATGTREAILQSALIAFTKHGYDGVGVREIASLAGVTAMLVNRYFGSKENLFAAAVDTAFTDKRLITGDISTLERTIANGLTVSDARKGKAFDPLLLLLRSASNARAAVILREGIDRHFGQPLAQSLPGRLAKERAALILALIAGVQLMREVILIPALVETDPTALSRSLAALLKVLIDPVEILAKQKSALLAAKPKKKAGSKSRHAAPHSTEGEER
jgi:AcrR family transcriptional regulator